MKKIKNFFAQSSNSSGFGIIEVLISAMIIVIVVGAAVGLSRAMVKRNIETTEKVQAYNLVREGLEIGRVYRDTKWIDKQPDEWNKDFPNGGSFYFKKDNIDGSFEIGIDSSEEVIKSENNIEYTRTYMIKNLSDDAISDLNDIVDPDKNQEYDLSDEIKVLNVLVSWNNDKNNVEASTILTNWKPQI